MSLCFLESQLLATNSISTTQPSVMYLLHGEVIVGNHKLNGISLNKSTKKCKL